METDQQEKEIQQEQTAKEWNPHNLTPEEIALQKMYLFARAVKMMMEEDALTDSPC